MASKRGHCQSCDMPLHRVPGGNGTEADGSVNADYCALCYQDGRFLWPGNDVKQFQKMVVAVMVKHGWWRPAAWVLTRRIPSLKRWKNLS